MTNQLIFNDFSAGWIPGDDPINGRKNGLLKMDNLDLNQNGKIQTCNGTTRQLTVFTNTLHSLYSKYIGTTKYTYSGDTAGVVFRNNTSIKTAGSTTRAAFNAAYNYVFGFSGDKRFKDDGTTTTDLGIIKPNAAPTLATGAAGNLTGDYEYCQINVLVNGAYQAKSARGPIGTLTLNAQVATVTPQNPSAVSSTGNEAWIFRRGVNLDTWYRIARVTSFGSFTDSMSDADALLTGVTMNDFLLSVNSTDTPDAILACVGPVYGRMLYFTAKQIIPSDIASPDSYDSRTVIGLAGSAGSEIFKWAILVNQKTVLVGTNKDVYILSGTYVQLPDGYLDISADGLGVDNPPIGIDVALKDNFVVYMSRIGWVACGMNGQTVSLVFPNLDYIYSGQATFEYGAVTIDPSGSTRYPCCISNNRLYTVVPLGAPTSASHMEVYDFGRKFWRPCYSGKTPKMLTATEDGKVLGFDDTDKFVKLYDDPTTKLLDDGAASKQTVGLLSMMLDDGKPKNKKDWGTLALRGGTNSSLTGVTVTLNFGEHVNSFGDIILTPDFKANLAGTGYYGVEKSWDVSGGTSDPGNVSQCVQLNIYGTPPLFSMQDVTLTYTDRPISELHINFHDLGLDAIDTNYISTLNYLINTNGQNVDFYPVIDGVVQTKSTVNTAKKLLASHHFSAAPGGTSWTGYFIATTVTPFEFYKWLPPTLNYKRPQYVKYVLFSLVELFKYGKIKEIEVRLAANAGLTSIPYSIALDNGTPVTGILTVTASVESMYRIPLPKTVAGSILTLTLGATTLLFSPIYCRALVAKSGRNTEEEWVTLNQNLIS